MRGTIATVAIAASLLAGACADGEVTTTTAAARATTSSTARMGGAVADANRATVAELTAAFQANGIGNASRWAREVEEYRPYPTNDPTMAKLRAELAKYNPGPGVVDAIVASLEL